MPPGGGPITRSANEALDGGRLFAEVSEVVVFQQQPEGVARYDLDGERLREAIECLGQTRELRVAPEEPPLDPIVLVEVVDRFGDRMFEPLSEHVIIGDRHRRYWSPCLASIALQPVAL